MNLIDEITLRNFKCHKNLKLTFGPGVTGIVGDNGTGKSSIISAIRFLFTGEVDTANKQECITVGETEGWVSGKFNLNGKAGTIERHLNVSKVVLKYNGVTYRNSSEVKALWDTLMQIDGSIFNNVIIAAQGDIPLLFSGDGAIRERIFQKIFLVPPTEKIRAVIWEHYIKTCPPEKLEEDISILQSQETEVAIKRNALLAEIDKKLTSVLTEPTSRCVIERISFLEKCKKDLLVKPTLEASLSEVNTQINDLEKHIKTETERLTTVDESSVNATYRALLSQRQLAEHKGNIEHELELLIAKAPTEKEVKDIRDKLVKLEAEEAEFKQHLDEANAIIKHKRTQLELFSQLEGQTTCPTCKQPIANLLSALELTRKELDLCDRDVVKANAEYTLANKKAQRTRIDKSLMEGQYMRVVNLQQQLSRFATVSFSDSDFKDISEIIEEIKDTKVRIQEYTTKLASLVGVKNVTQEKINNLAHYDGPASIEEELQMMQNVLTENHRRLTELEGIRVEQAKLEHELRLLEERINVSTINSKYNAKRQAYLDKLQAAYNVLHVQAFPRTLIQSYAEQVESFLSKYLNKFNIPYRAKIQEGFKIQMSDVDDRDMPGVSGGQKVIVGICLRLALHNMFAQAFPLWIVDEGTTHLSEGNRTAYFKLIEDLKKERAVEQVIIIDHDPQLTNVVDNTIQL